MALFTSLLWPVQDENRAYPLSIAVAQALHIYRLDIMQQMLTDSHHKCQMLNK